MSGETAATLQGTGGGERRRGRRPSPSRPTKSPRAAIPVAAGETGLLDALTLAEEGLAAAEESYWRVLDVLERSLGPEDPEVATIHRRLAMTEQCRGRRAEAEAHVRMALALHKKALGPRDPATAADEVALGQLLAAEGRYEEAQPLLREAHRTLRSALGRQAPETLLVSQNLSALAARRRPEPVASQTAG
jgi:tetratricopeptide (TPR) repeat protein